MMRSVAFVPSDVPPSRPSPRFRRGPFPTMKITTLLWCATVVAACANVVPPNAAETERLNEARRLLTDDPHRACAIADELLAANKGLRDALLVRADGVMRIARNDPRNREPFLRGAAADLEQAIVGLDEADAAPHLLQLSECYAELGEFQTGAAVATRAAAAFAELGVPTARRSAAQAMLLAGRCDLRQFDAARQAELEGTERDQRGTAPIGAETARLATTAAGRFAAARSEFPGEAIASLALIQRRLGQTGEALREYERGLLEFPREVAIHDAYIQWMVDNGQVEAMVGSYSRLVRSNPTVTPLRWHQGRALFLRADRLRFQGNFQAAMEGYQKADAVFGDYGAMVPADRGGSDQWRALCNLSRARVAVEMGDLKTAAAEILLAAERSPATTTYQDGAPTLIDSFREHFTGVAFAVHVALSESGDDALARTLAFDEQLLQRCPERWSWAYNNAALAARDLGVARSAAGDTAAAKELWQRSYRHYRKAMALAPDDARTVNDTALMLVYHLERDYDEAETLFRRAIDLGAQRLAALPADAERSQREALEEAVGDAWQNLAVLYKERLQRPFADYRTFCEESVKFFPYARREAAAMLRNDGKAEIASTARSSGGSEAVGSDTPAQGGAAEELAKIRSQVDEKAKNEDFDGALSLLDTVAKACREHAPFHALRGELGLKLAQQALANNRKGVDLFFQDAVGALTRAVELDPEPVPPRLMLAEAQFAANQVEESVTTLTRTLLHMQSQGGGKPEHLLTLHTLRARAGGLLFAQKQGNDKELLDAVRASYRYVDEKGKLDPQQIAAWATTEEWAKAGAEAVRVYARGLQKSPGDQALLDGIVAIGYRTEQMALAVEALQKLDDAVGVWYLGKARFWLADAEARQQKLSEAQTTLDQAKAAFADSMAKNAAFKDSCDMWTAMVLGKKGNLALRAKDFANAETWLLESVRLRPDQIGTELGTNETTKLAVQILADHYFKQENLAKTEAIYRAASDAANGDGDLLNNAGLFARDHGKELEQAGKKAEAMAMYEQSYKAYSRALQLEPTSVGLRNDTALIAIYHLDRDWDLSKERLDGAIRDGEATLKNAPPKEPNDRQALEMAVGDSYENLALWHLRHSKDFAAAKAAAEKSMTYFPKARRPGARQWLREAEQGLQGK
jgi:tetratricopeptide (TPR) repeat protein